MFEREGWSSMVLRLTGIHTRTAFEKQTLGSFVAELCEYFVRNFGNNMRSLAGLWWAPVLMTMELSTDGAMWQDISFIFVLTRIDTYE
jgi:hypothetical protein